MFLSDFHQECCDVYLAAKNDMASLWDRIASQIGSDLVLPEEME